MNFEALIWSNYGKFVMVLLMAIIVLQGYNMMYLIKLQETKRIHVERRGKEETGYAGHKELKDIQKIIIDSVHKLEEAHISDPSGFYFVVPKVIEAEVDDSEYTVALCSQTTVNHLHYLKDLSETWQGPISVTVFTHGSEAVQALYKVLYMRLCYESVRNYVTFHVMYPIKFQPVDLHEILSMKILCGQTLSPLFDDSEKKLNYDNEIPYPHNILRNIAITYTSSQYVFMIDIDMVPSSGLGQFFQRFIQRKSVASNDKTKADKEKQVYVIPAFESNLTTEIISKEYLLKEWEAKNVRPFYSTVCWKCQEVTDYDRWKELPNIKFLDIGYITEWEYPWEPFYIAEKSDLPLYDGRFKQYGFNRISQVCELHVAGYQFAVLNNAFIVHRGFKEVGKFHRKKQIENAKNKELFRVFKSDLKDRYPDSAYEC